MIEPIRVLIVEDSVLFREVLAKGLSMDKSIQVVAKAANALEASEKILLHEPDVITCDVEMPGMSGIEFVRRLMQQYPLPVVVVSAMGANMIDAMEAGAVDFVAKPNMNSQINVESFILNLINKVKEASKAKVRYQTNTRAAKMTYKMNVEKYKVIAMGASTGGTEALFSVLKSLPNTVPGIVVVQHIPPMFSKMFADRLNVQTEFEVKEAANGDVCKRGRVLIAPGDKHMIVKKTGSNYHVEVFHGDRINGHCPSVDVLFESVAKECATDAMGVIMTGMGYDGAKGLLHMRRKGAHTIGQDENSSVVYGMPKVAYDIGAVEKQVPLQEISNTICSFMK